MRETVQWAVSSYVVILFRRLRGRPSVEYALLHGVALAGHQVGRVVGQIAHRRGGADGVVLRQRRVQVVEVVVQQASPAVRAHLVLDGGVEYCLVHNPTSALFNSNE